MSVRACGHQSRCNMCLCSPPAAYSSPLMAGAGKELGNPMIQQCIDVSQTNREEVLDDRGICSTSLGDYVCDRTSIGVFITTGIQLHT